MGEAAAMGFGIMKTSPALQLPVVSSLGVWARRHPKAWRKGLLGSHMGEDPSCCIGEGPPWAVNAGRRKIQAKV